MFSHEWSKFESLLEMSTANVSFHVRPRIKCSIFYLSRTPKSNHPPSSKSRNTSPHFDLAVLTRKSKKKNFLKPSGPKPPPSHLGYYTRLTVPSSVQGWKWHDANFSFPWLPTALTVLTRHSDPRSFSMQPSPTSSFYTPLDLFKSWKAQKSL